MTPEKSRSCLISSQTALRMNDKALMHKEMTTMKQHSESSQTPQASQSGRRLVFGSLAILATTSVCLTPLVFKNSTVQASNKQITWSAAKAPEAVQALLASEKMPSMTARLIPGESSGKLVRKKLVAKSPKLGVKLNDSDGDAAGLLPDFKKSVAKPEKFTLKKSKAEGGKNMRAKVTLPRTKLKKFNAQINKAKRLGKGSPKMSFVGSVNNDPAVFKKSVQIQQGKAQKFQITKLVR
jgi:hypothetical protein